MPVSKMSSQDRSNLICLAASLPVGDASRRAILAGLKISAEDTSDLPEPLGGYHWEEADGGFALMKGSTEKGFIIKGPRSWLSYTANDESPIGRGQNSAYYAAQQLITELGI